MQSYFSLFLLAFTLSLDSCSVGLTYGLRKVMIPFKSIIVISLCSAIIMFVSMAVGDFLIHMFSPILARQIGGLVLVGIGSWVLYQFFSPDHKEEQEPNEKTLWNIEILLLGIVIQILRKPTVADFDRSGAISAIEALLLGLALSIDSFGAGIGASLLGYSSWMMALLVACMSGSFLFFGMKLGECFQKSTWIQQLTFLPGVLLIMIGIWKM
ncbi:sporulation membrane protein YtaF [Ectobacillus polymachus]|uniref:sporulation membrane protein YtaF n=1 Tax=Ectobacillus polymachus TaxID=1508806 RepID=UPI003A894B92